VVDGEAELADDTVGGVAADRSAVSRPVTVSTFMALPFG
jgi:hypothetical protein